MSDRAVLGLLLPHVALHCAFCDLDPKLQQLALDPLGTPQPMIGGHLFNQGDRLRSKLGLTRTGT